MDVVILDLARERAAIVLRSSAAKRRVSGIHSGTCQIQEPEQNDINLQGPRGSRSRFEGHLAVFALIF
jgi:hypothetical protein